MMLLVLLPNATRWSSEATTACLAYGGDKIGVLQHMSECTKYSDWIQAS